MGSKVDWRKRNFTKWTAKPLSRFKKELADEKRTASYELLKIPIINLNFSTIIYNLPIPIPLWPTLAMISRSSAAICHSEICPPIKWVLILLPMQAHFSSVKKMLDNMFIGSPEGNYDRLLDFSTAKSGSLFFVPTLSFLDNASSGLFLGKIEIKPLS